MKNRPPVLDGSSWGRCGRCHCRFGALRVKAEKFDGTVCYMCLRCAERNRVFAAFL